MKEAMDPAHAIILLIEDEPQMRRLLRTTLSAHGYGVLEAPTGKAGLVLAEQDRPAAVLLDLGLPDMDGLEVTRQLRAFTHAPILVVSARGREIDKVMVLDAGADDYLTKPFGVDELLARLRVALRHATSIASGGETAFTLGEWSVDLARREVRAEGGALTHLTPIEWRFLTVLYRHAGLVVTHRQILREVWGEHAERETQYLRVHMANLRRKLERDPARPRHLLNEAGVGYRLRVEPSPA